MCEPAGGPLLSGPPTSPVLPGPPLAPEAPPHPCLRGASPRGSKHTPEPWSAECKARVSGEGESVFGGTTLKSSSAGEVGP